MIEHFFDLTRFAHRELFELGHPPWRALDHLAAYFSSWASRFRDEENVQRLRRAEKDGAYLVNREQIFLGPETSVEPGAYLRGPLITGTKCEIRHGAYLRGNIIAGDRCVLGHGTEIKHSILLDRAKAAHFAYLGDSILGNDANLGAGTKCANLRFDSAPIRIHYREQKWATARRKLGAIIGDLSQTGCNCTLNPGSLLERGARVYPGHCVHGWVGDSETHLHPHGHPPMSNE